VWSTEVVPEKSGGCITQSGGQLPVFCILTSLVFSNSVVLFAAAVFGKKE